MVDAGAQEVNFVLRNVDVARNEIHGSLHTMAEADEFHFRRAQRPADHRHGVHVLEHIRLGAEFLHIPGQVEHNGYLPLGAEDTPGAQGVTDTLIDAIFQRDLIVVLEPFDPCHLEGGDHVIGVPDRFSGVGCLPDLCRQVIGLNDSLGKRLYLRGACGAGGHQGEFGVLQAIRRQDVQHKSLTKDNTSCTYDSNLRHP